jgi:hypothetical protein
VVVVSPNDFKDAKRQRIDEVPATFEQKAKRGKSEAYAQRLRAATLRPVGLSANNGSQNNDTSRGRG